ncbi:MAG: 50S ribosomal protein L13 [Spirochaetes bacterium]|jgi:large subunit ribosomal protein L13|nr:50S ribosomal protein L13 [Spirochaetota bacterium]
MKTINPDPNTIERKWYVVDAEGKTLGHVATNVAHLLRGKHRPYFSPDREIGDFVIVVNAAKVELTGRKADQKMYYRHSGYLGGMKSFNFRDMMKRKPVYPVEHAVKGMLPKNRLGRKIFQNMKVYAGPTHPHVAQKPEQLEI